MVSNENELARLIDSSIYVLFYRSTGSFEEDMRHRMKHRRSVTIWLEFYKTVARL